jgi:hypothetical protein
MKMLHLSAISLLLAAAPLRAEFLVLKVREKTAEQIWFWIAIVTALLILSTMRASRNKGGHRR